MGASEMPGRGQQGTAACERSRQIKAGLKNPELNRFREKTAHCTSHSPPKSKLPASQEIPASGSYAHSFSKAFPVLIPSNVNADRKSQGLRTSL